MLDNFENVEPPRGAEEKPAAETSEGREIISTGKLMEASVYFGHKTAAWNPKMKLYITPTPRKGVHIIDLQRTKRALKFAYDIIYKFAERDASFIFVGTRKQAKQTVRENALRTNSFYVSERWLGGTLTNSRTILNSVKRLNDLEMLAENNFADYTKKEGVLFTKELAKLKRNLEGIRNMRNRPQVMIVADPRVDEIAVREARKTGVRVIAIVDTNADPNSVDIAIPGNDDSVKSVTLIMTILADAIAAAKGGKQLFAFQPDEAIVLPDEPKVERPPRRPGQRPYVRRYGPGSARPGTTGSTSSTPTRVISATGTPTTTPATSESAAAPKPESK